MPARFLRLAVFVCIGLWPLAAAWSQSSSAEKLPAGDQPARAAPPPGVSPPQSPHVEASQLDTFLLRDNKGNLVPVLGLPFEEFEQLWRLKRGLTPPPPPGFIFESLTIVGAVNDKEKAADFQVQAVIQVRDDGWVRVPFYFSTAVMRQPPQYAGPGEHLFTFDVAAGGHVCWLKGKDSRPHVLTLPVSIRLRTEGGQSQLTARLPQATESSLRLTIPQASVQAELAAGEGIIATQALGSTGTEIRLVGAGGEVQLTWRQQSETLGSGTPQIDATGEITARVEGRQRLTSEARLRVRSNGAALDKFVVRLPAGMELVPLPAATGYSMQLLAQPHAKGALVEVRLDRPTTTVSEVVLRAQRQPDAAAEATIAPGRFEVQGALRQRGTIDFVTEGEWQLDWAEDRSVHRLEVPPEAAAAGVVARYEYFRQPCELALTVAPRPARLSVEPTHLVFVEPRQVRIETLLKCRFRGARAKGLRLELEDWDFDRLSPDALFDFPVAGEQGTIFVPFRDGAAAPSEIEIKLEAHRPLPPASERLSFAMPRAEANNVAPATVAIFAADNVELTPRAGELVGLSPEPTTGRPAGRQQPPSVYRDLGGGERAVFVAGIRILARSTTVAARAVAKIDSQQLQVEQRLDYRVAHEPQRLFPLTAPSEVAAGGNLQVWLGDELLSITPQLEGNDRDDSLRRLSFSTPTDQIGPFQVSVRYALPLRWDRSAPLQLAVPLVLPIAEGDDQFTGQQLEFALAAGLQVEPQADELDEQERPTQPSSAAQLYSWSRPVSVSRWVLASSPTVEGAAIRVPQMWVQTWLAPRTRQDRVALRISTQRDSVLLKIPKGVKQSSVQAAIDGQEAQRNFRQPGMLVVALPPTARGRECVLEVCYALEPAASWLGFCSDEWRSVQIEGAEPPARVFWQLALPEDEHLLVPPGELAAEMTWPGDRWTVRRRPVFDQRQLEAWIKATPQEPLPRGANDYLFGTLGRWPTLQVTIARRRSIVVAASGLVLIVGLLLIHVPAWRRPELALALAILIAGGAVAAPELAWLIGQGATVGLVIVALAAVVARFATSPALPAPNVSTLVARTREATSTQPPASRSGRSSRISTTAPGHPAVMEVRP